MIHRTPRDDGTGRRNLKACSQRHASGFRLPKAYALPGLRHNT